MCNKAPNFFIVGAPKAGTDRLYYDLDQHQAIYMSPLKEPNFFASEIRLPNFEPSVAERMKKEADSVREYIRGDMSEKRFGGILCEWEEYLRLFAGITTETAVGECSVSYLWSRTAAEAIASRIPDAKIVIVLMDPAERAFAQYLKSVSDGSVAHSFRKHLQICFEHKGEALGVFHPFLEFGMYSQQVGRYLKNFPSPQVSISLYEDVRSQPDAWFSGLLQFLGVDPGFVPRPGPDLHRNANVPKFARVTQALHRFGLWQMLSDCIPSDLRPTMKRFVYRNTASTRMRPEERAMLIDYYRDDIHCLEGVLNRNLQTWLR